MHNWRTAFLHQAASDYRMFKRCRKIPTIESCHAAHYLQMASEKTAKSLMTLGVEQPRPVHQAMTIFIKRAKQNLRMRHRWPGGEKAFYANIDGLGGFIANIEKWAPESSATMPNPEYPWCSVSSTQVCVPMNYRFIELSRENAPLLKKYLKFLEILFSAHGIDVSIDE